MDDDDYALEDLALEEMLRRYAIDPESIPPATDEDVARVLEILWTRLPHVPLFKIRW